MNRAAFTIYLIVLVLGPLLFGAVHTYAYTLMALCVLIGMLLITMDNIKKDPKTGQFRLRFLDMRLNIVFLLMVVFLIVQVIPLTDSLLALLSPTAEIVWGKSLPAWGIAEEGASSKEWFSLAPYVYPVRMSIVRFIVYGLFFFGLIQALNSQKRIERLIFLLLAMGCFEALYGLIQAYSGSPQVLWFKSITDRNAATGTYVNRNHFAGFMEMGLILAVAFSAALSEREKKPATEKGSFRTKISRLLSGEQLFNKRALILFAGIVMGIGLIFSASRGGMIAAAGGLLCMGILFMFKKTHRGKGLLILVLFLMIAGYSLYIGVEYPISRFDTFELGLEARLNYVKNTLKMFDDYRLTGVGVGNFQYAYPMYQSPGQHLMLLDFAHNDWVQFLAEAGIVGFLLLLVGMGYSVFKILRLWKKRSDPFAVSLGAGALGAIVAMALHSFSDFNLHIPANFLILLAIMAIGYSALHLERHHRRDRMNYRIRLLPLKFKGAFVLVIVLGLIGWSGYATIRHFVAEAYCNTVNNSTLNRDQEPPLEEIQGAIWWDSNNAEYWYKLALELGRVRSDQLISLADAEAHKAGEGNVTGESRPNMQLEIIRALETAVRLNPFQAKYHLQLGWEYTWMVDDPDYLKKWVPAADICMDRAAYFTGDKDPALQVSLGNYWVMRSKSFLPGQPEYETAWAKSIVHYRKAQVLKAKALQKEIRDFVWMFYPDEEIVRQVIVAD
jgi:O-antigen ligase